MKSTIKRMQNYPSMLVWTSGNESHAMKELYDAIRNSVGHEFLVAANMQYGLSMCKRCNIA